ncbi:hypothetical protein VTH06DRAFT_2000 [Thermothelomyces fergusii]
MATDLSAHLSFREAHIVTASSEITINRATTADTSPSLSPEPWGDETEVQRGRKRHRTTRDIKPATATATAATKHRPRPCPGSTDSRTLRGRARNRSISVVSATTTTTVTTTTSTPSPALPHAFSPSRHPHHSRHGPVPHCHHDHDKQQQHTLSEGLTASHLGVAVRAERWQDSTRGSRQRQKAGERARLVAKGGMAWRRRSQSPSRSRSPPLPPPLSPPTLLFTGVDNDTGEPGPRSGLGGASVGDGTAGVVLVSSSSSSSSGGKRRRRRRRRQRTTSRSREHRVLVT